MSVLHYSQDAKRHYIHTLHFENMWELLSKNIRFSVTLLLLAASIILLTTVFSFVNKETLLYIIGLSVASSGVSTTLVQIIAQITERAERFTNQRRFLKIFGCDKASITNGSIAIVIPAFDLSHSISNQPSNSLKQQAQKLVSKASTKAAIKNDVAAASHIISAFSKLEIPIPQIKSDDEINFNFDDSDHISTYIMIGFSNNIIDFIRNTNDKHFEVVPVIDNNNLTAILIKIGSYDGANLLPEHRWTVDSIPLDPQTGDPVNDIDYALFAKFRIKNKIILICGAGTEFGTHDIGMYIGDGGWRQVYAELKKEKGKAITASEKFAVTFQVPIGKRASEGISIAHKCIRKVNA